MGARAASARNKKACALLINGEVIVVSGGVGLAVHY